MAPYMQSQRKEKLSLTHDPTVRGGVFFCASSRGLRSMGGKPHPAGNAPQFPIRELQWPVPLSANPLVLLLTAAENAAPARIAAALLPRGKRAAALASAG